MSYYPDITYPNDPEFPIGHEDVPIGEDLYSVIISYISDMATYGSSFLLQDGNIVLDADKGIKWDGTTRISLVGGEINVTALQINTALVCDTPTITTLNITGDCDVVGDLNIDGAIAVTGTITTDHVERTTHTFTALAEPANPANDQAVIWLSNGTGYGNNTDWCAKITEGGGTSSFTISAYSEPNFLYSAQGVDVATIGGTEYAFVACSGLSDSLVIIDVSTPATPTYVAHIRGAGAPNYLGGARRVKVYTVGGTEYALVASPDDDCLSIIDVSTPAAPVLTGIFKGAGAPNYMAGACDVDACTIGGTEYALVVGEDDDSLVVVDISTPATPALTNAHIEAFYFNGPKGVKWHNMAGVGDVAVVVGDNTIAVIKDLATAPSREAVTYSTFWLSDGQAVATWTDVDDVALIARTPDTPTGELTHAVFDPAVGTHNEYSSNIDGAADVDTYSIGGTQYAFVTASDDDLLAILNVDNAPAEPSTGGSTSFVADISGAANYLEGASGVKIYDVGGTEYAFVASADSNALVVIDVSTPASPSKVGEIFDY